MKKINYISIFILSFFAACTGAAKISQGNDAAAATQRTNDLTSASVEISAQTGGYVNVGSTKLKIPAQALSADTKITAELTDIQLPEGGPKAVGKGIKLSPEGLQFLTPAELEICYPGTDLATLNEKRVLVYYQMDNGEFAGIAGTVDQNTHCVKSHIEHFSSYVAAAVTLSGPISPPNVNTVNLLPATPYVGMPVRIRTIIDDFNGATPGIVVAATIHYKINNGAEQVAPLQIDPTDDTVVNRYYFEIPGNLVTLGGNIKYYIEAVDNVGQHGYRPAQPANPALPRTFTTINYTTATAVRLTPASAVVLAAGNLQISAGFSHQFAAQATVNGTTWFNIPASGYALSSAGLGTVVQTGPSTIRFNATGAQAGQLTLNQGTLSSTFPVNVVPGLLTHIEITDMNQVILTGTANLPTGQPYNFDVIGFDAFGNVATILPGFNTTGGIGTVSANALTGAVFQAGSTVTNGTIDVNLAGLTDSLAVTLYAPPQVTATAPSAGTTGIALNSTIGVSFSHVMNTSTITTNTGSIGPCTGTIQVSSDNFVTCIPMTSANPAFFATNTLAVITPAVNLSGSTVYQIRVTAAALDTSGYPIAPEYVTIPGFTTVPGPATTAWIATGSVATARVGHTATKLPDGRVLITGGNVGLPNYLSSTEIYNPTTGTFTPGPAMAFIRGFHTATGLADGRVLITGGTTGTQVLAHAEIFDPTTNTFSATGLMTEPRALHAATLLADGRVLISAGFFDPGSTYLLTAEIYDPATGIFTATGSLAAARRTHTATLMADGRVIIIGGWNGSTPMSSVEIFNPVSGTFSTTGGMSIGRVFNTATLLPNGRVLVTGGTDNTFAATLFNSAEVYDPGTGLFATPINMNVVRAGHTANLLLNGTVLITGGHETVGTPGSTAEIFDPASGNFTFTVPMIGPRFFHTTTLLNDGRVLAVGYQAMSEIYQP